MLAYDRRTELDIIQSLLARPANDPNVSTEFREAAIRWEKELASGKYLRLTDKQRSWLFKVEDTCEAHDIGVPVRGFGGLYGDEEDDTYEHEIDPDIGDR